MPRWPHPPDFERGWRIFIQDEDRENRVVTIYWYESGSTSGRGRWDMTPVVAHYLVSCLQEVWPATFYQEMVEGDNSHIVIPLP